RAHSGLGRLLGDRLVGKDADPDLAAALDVPGHGAASRLDLAVAHPARFHRLQAELTERHGGAARRDALAAAAVHLAVLDTLRHQHQDFFLGVVLFLAVARPKSMSARSVCSGTRPSRSHSRRAISAPRSRPPQYTRTPFAPERIVRRIACFIARL